MAEIGSKFPSGILIYIGPALMPPCYGPQPKAVAPEELIETNRLLKPRLPPHPPPKQPPPDSTTVSKLPGRASHRSAGRKPVAIGGDRRHKCGERQAHCRRVSAVANAELSLHFL